jgi:phosphoglycerate dehydrogenase-like enzyme
MRTVKVLVAHHLVRGADLERIEAVAPGVRAVEGVYLDTVTQRWLEQRAGAPPERAEPIDPEAFLRHARDAEVIFALRLPADIVDGAPKLRWVHIYGAGVDSVGDIPLSEHDITLTNSAGINAGPIAETVALYLLAHAKRLVTRIDDQRMHQWTPRVNAELRDATLGIIGPGHIGQEVAKRAAAFGMHVLTARRSYTPGEQLPCIEEVFPLSRLHEMLGRCDYVVTAVALTPETDHMLGPDEFGAMKPGAFFVNVARGGVVDQQALLEALRSGRLSGAGLDVFDPEPLAADSPFWDLPNVIVTPHNASGVTSHAERAIELFCENLRRYLAGEPLVNAVSGPGSR